MRRFLPLAGALALASAAVVTAQKAMTPEDLDKAMKRIPPAHGAVNKAIQAGAYADAKKQLGTVKAALADAHQFWVVTKKADAVKLSQDALDKADALEKLLAAPAPDAQAALAAFKQYVGTCGACHQAFRAQDANQQYILKPGTL